jgi:hypothetical protein
MGIPQTAALPLFLQIHPVALLRRSSASLRVLPERCFFEAVPL